MIQCAKIVDSLRYHYADWLYAFKLAGLSASVAFELKSLLLESLPQSTLEMHHIAGELQDSHSARASRADHIVTGHFY